MGMRLAGAQQQRNLEVTPAQGSHRLLFRVKNAPHPAKGVLDRCQRPPAPCAWLPVCGRGVTAVCVLTRDPPAMASVWGCHLGCRRLGGMDSWVSVSVPQDSGLRWGPRRWRCDFPRGMQASPRRWEGKAGAGAWTFLGLRLLFCARGQVEWQVPVPPGVDAQCPRVMLALAPGHSGQQADGKPLVPRSSDTAKPQAPRALHLQPGRLPSVGVGSAGPQPLGLTRWGRARL